MPRYTGILVGSFRDFNDVVMERSCVERGSKESALADAELMLRLTTDEDARGWVADVEVAE